MNLLPFRAFGLVRFLCGEPNTILPAIQAAWRSGARQRLCCQRQSATPAATRLGSAQASLPNMPIRKHGHRRRATLADRPALSLADFLVA
jgi:hypothetical protein